METKQDFDSEVARWIAELDHAETHQDKWVRRAKGVIKRYRDERDQSNTATKFNILWSNTETLKPAVYYQSPKPNVSRRFKDKDPVGRVAAQVLERALEFSMDSYEFDDVVKDVVEDYLLPGRGIARGVYKSEVGMYAESYEEEVDGEFQQLTREYERKNSESAECEYWHWEDVIIPKCKKWKKTPWIAFRAYMTRDELLKLSEKGLFDEKTAKAIPLDHKPEPSDAPETYQKAKIYEIWDKEQGKVVFISRGYHKVLSNNEPGLNLTGFYPIPKPLLAVKTNDTNLPIPLYAMYQDQAKELDNLTSRISLLVDSLRVTGVYDGSVSTLKKLVEGGENKLYPVDSWAMLAEKGGIKGAVDFFPLQDIAATLIQLYSSRDQVKQDLYEISGIADIIRGYSNPNETATAQKIKGRFASLRLEDHQKAVQRFIRDSLRIKAEIIADNFEMETLQRMTGIEGIVQTPQGPVNVWPQVMELLRDDISRTFRIDIETDSTIRPDEEEEKARRVEFLEASGAFMEKAMVAAQQMPTLAPLLGEMLLFAVRGFKVGRDLEDKFETALAQIAQQPAQQQQDPRAIEAQSRAQERGAKLQMDQQDHQMGMAHRQQEMLQSKQEHDQKMAHNQQEFEQDMQLSTAGTVTDILAKQRKLQDG